MDSTIYEFFDEIIKLLQEIDRQYGIVNANFTDYALGRLEHCIIACTTIRERLEMDSGLELKEYCHVEQFNRMFERNLRMTSGKSRRM